VACREGLWVHLWRGRPAAGQGMVEYGLILVAVAVVVVIALFAIGPKVASMFVTAGASLSSDRAKKANRAAVDARAVARTGRCATHHRSHLTAPARLAPPPLASAGGGFVSPIGDNMPRQGYSRLDSRCGTEHRRAVG
jgi:Flp pilus assembly pilin Flp